MSQAAMQRRPGWLSALLGPDGQALAVIALVWVAFFGRLFIPVPGLRASFPPGDFVDQFYAFAVHEARELQAGRLPLWGPYAYSGHPFLADVQSAIFYPVSLGFTLAAAFVLRTYTLTWLTLEAAAHFLLAGLFTYALGRHLFRHRGAALVAALTFTYGGYLTGYPPLQLAVLETDVWLPLLLLFVDKAISDDAHSLRWTVAAGMTWGVAILAGHPQSAMYLSYVTLAFALVRLVQRRPGLGRASLLALVPGFALGLSAAQWLPTVEYTRLSVRASATFQELAGGFPFRDVVQYAVPRVVSLWSPLYVGLLPLALVVVALVHRPERMVWFWAALGGVALLLSFGAGTPVYRLFYLLVPGFNLFRSQERAAFVVSFAMALLAGYGYLALERGGMGRAGRRLMGATAAALVLLAGMSRVGAGHDAWVPRLAVAALLVALIGLWSWQTPRWRARRRLVAAVLLIAGDLFLANADVNLVPPFDLTQVYPAPIVEPMVQDPSFFRARNEWRLPGNYGFLYRIEETWGASPLRLQAYEEMWEALPEERRWEILGVKYVITWHGEVPEQGTTVLAQVPKGDETTYLHQVDDPSPLAWLVRETEVLPDAETRLARLADPAFDPRRVAVLHSPLPQPLPGSSDAGDLVRVAERAPGQVTLDVEAKTAGLLVLSELYYPGWRASIDGAPATVVPADHVLMAVMVPAGHHQVELRFGSTSARAGLAISGLTLLVAGTLLAVSRRRGRTRPA